MLLSVLWSWVYALCVCFDVCVFVCLHWCGRSHRQESCGSTICWLHMAALHTTAVFWLVSSLHWPFPTPPVLNQHSGSRLLKLKSPSILLFLLFIKINTQQQRAIMTHCIITAGLILYFAIAIETLLFFYIGYGNMSGIAKTKVIILYSVLLTEILICTGSDAFYVSCLFGMKRKKVANVNRNAYLDWTDRHRFKIQYKAT